MKISQYLSIIIIILISSCKENKSEELLQNEQKANILVSKNDSPNKIQILNFGTFHMGMTSDAHKTEFDEHSEENKKKVHQIAKMLSSFKPTVLIVEKIPEYDQKLQSQYKAYCNDPSITFNNPSEVQLLAYELGRLCDTKRIYGIDHKMEYNYNIGNEIENMIDPIWHDSFYKAPLSFYPSVSINQEKLSLLDKLKQTNLNEYLDFLITANADMLTHVGTDSGFEGADQAAKYYQRNLRMFSNLNRIKLNKNDRVFILMGASHTAFFRDFISRSPKYEMVNTFDYLK